MRDFLKNKLEEIRNSGPGKKIKWVVFMSAAAMAIIVCLWLFWLGQGMDRPPAENLPNSEIGKWEIFKAGFKVLTSKIFGPRTINIE
jgi:hypothetical protein